MIPVSASFLASENSDVNKPQVKVQLVLGDYCVKNIATTNIDKYSTDWPVYGMCDGDRTELNAGPASGAYNGVGLSCWRSSNKPDGVHTSYRAFANIAFDQGRYINRLKIYHHSAHPLKEYVIYGGVVGSWGTQLVSTTGAFDLSSPLVTITSNQQLDIIDLPYDFYTYGLRIMVDDVVHHGEEVYVIEMEAYRVMDITSRVMSVNLDEGQDFKFGNPIASQTTINCDNSDRYFSFDYVPTTSEISSGFVNNEIAPNVGIILSYGFNNEYWVKFTGSIDRITINPGGRTASIVGRDNLKRLLNQTLSCKLKPNTDIADLVKYVLNICNFSSWEISVDTTGIVIDYFFTNQEYAVDTIRKLVQAAGDASFTFFPYGNSVFYNYMANVQQRAVYTTATDFQSCSLTNIDPVGFPNQIQKQWVLIEDWTTGTRSGTGWAYEAWIAATTTSGDGGTVIYTPTGGGFMSTSSPYTTGTWEARLNRGTYVSAQFVFMSKYDFYTRVGWASDAYWVSFNSGGAWLYRSLSGTRTGLASTSVANDENYHTVRVTRDVNGLMNVYFDGTLILTATDTTVDSCAYFGMYINAGGSFGKIYYSNAILDPTVAVSTATSYIESGSIDQSALITAEQLFQSYNVVPASSSIVFQTRTSTDGSSWGSWTTATSGSTIPSTTHQYIEWNATLTDTMNVLFSFVQATIYDVELNWLTGAGRAKYPTTISKYIADSTTLLGISQDYTDELAGDTAVYNDIQVQAQPMILMGDPTGVPADNIQWQATVGTPPVGVSASNPFPITNGVTYTFNIVPDNPVDTNRMSGASPACIAITFASSGTGTYSFTYISPTAPILQIVCTHTGTITNLQLIETHFENNNTILLQEAKDTSSISSYGLRSYNISNEFIVNPNFALSIANSYISQFKDPRSYISQCIIRPTFSILLGDRVNVSESNTNLHTDYIVVGIKTVYSLSDIHTEYTLMELLV